MLNFSNFLTEATKIKDFIGGKTSSETERHRKQYYDDSHPEGTFNKINGRYVFADDRTDIHPDFKKDTEIKLEKVEPRTGSDGKVRYHGIVGDRAIPMSSFQKPKELKKRSSDPTKVEKEQIESIKSQIESAMRDNGGKPIQVRTADGKVHRVAGIKSVPGNKKADAYLHDEHGNPLHYMSLKGDAYQQWGGYTDVFDHPKTKDIIGRFQQLKKEISPDSTYLPSGSIFHHTLNRDDPEERKLIMRAMYGKKHGGKHGEENVHAIYGGNTVALKKDEGGIYSLHTDALHVNRNDDTSDVTDAKVMLHKSSGHNQQGTGGRITIQHALNVPSSVDINNLENRNKKIRSLSVSTKNIEPAESPVSQPEIKQPKPIETYTVGGLPWKK